MNWSAITTDHPHCLKLEGFGRFDRLDRRDRPDRSDKAAGFPSCPGLGKAAEADGFGGFLPTFCPKSMHVKKFFFMRASGKTAF